MQRYREFGIRVGIRKLKNTYGSGLGIREKLGYEHSFTDPEYVTEDSKVGEIMDTDTDTDPGSGIRDLGSGIRIRIR
jgi:hypothetical protein